MKYVMPNDENHVIFKHWRLDSNNNLIQVCGANIINASKQANQSENTGMCLPDSFDYEEKTTNGTRKIKSLESISVIVPQGEKLEQYFDRLPYGILDKRITGIGATTLELKSQRNSIIVVPSKSLAYSKYKQKDNPESPLYEMNAIYVGSAIGNDCPRLSDVQVKEFIENSQLKKKIIVVADSLGRVLEIIGKENYDDYFLMIDEVDIIQSDSTFRPALENVIDYYLEFKQENKCLVSATIKELPHPLLQKEIIVTTQYETSPSRDILLINTNNPHTLLKEKIQEFFNCNNQDKIVIAYNSISYIISTILLLPENIRRECAILCSESSKADATYIDNENNIIDCYTELTDGYLNKRVTFMTCAYFVGIDIFDRFHLISVSNVNKLYTLLSIEKIIQIKGRCRPSEGVLSDTIIYSTKVKDEFNIENYRKSLEEKANGILKLYEVAQEISARTPEIAHFFHKLCEDICIAGKESIPGDNKYVALTRMSVVTEEFKMSYFNIDSLVEKRYLRDKLYSDASQLKTEIEAQKNWTITYVPNENRVVSEEQNTNENRNIDNNRILDLQEIDNIRDNIRSIIIDETNIGSISFHIAQWKRGKRKKTIAFLDAFHELYKYVEFDILFENLKSKIIDARLLRKYKNAICFFALEDNHPFKEDIFSSFEVGQTYLRSEVHSKLCYCFENNRLPIPSTGIKSVQYLSVFFNIYNSKIGNNNKFKILNRYSYEVNNYEIPTERIGQRTSLRQMFEFI